MNEIELPFATLTHYGQVVRIAMRPIGLEPSAGTLRPTNDGLEVYTGSAWIDLSTLVDIDQPLIGVEEAESKSKSIAYERAMSVVAK